MTYLEQFKNERYIVKSLFRNRLFYWNVDNTSNYRNITCIDATDLVRQKKEMKYSAMDHFWGILLLKDYDHGRYNQLSVEWFQAYTNK